MAVSVEEKACALKVFSNFLTFSYFLAERLDAWSGKITIDMFKIVDEEAFAAMLQSVLAGKGCFILNHNNFVVNTFLCKASSRAALYMSIQQKI